MPFRVTRCPPMPWMGSPFEEDLAAGGLDEARDGLHGGAFTRTVGADDADILPHIDLYRDIPEDLQESIAGVEIFDFQKHGVLRLLDVIRAKPRTDPPRRPGRLR